MAAQPRGGAPFRRKRKPRRKVVVHDLPPHMPASVFWSAVSAWVRVAPSMPSTSDAQPVRATSESTATVVYAEYVQGKRSDRYVA